MKKFKYSTILYIEQSHKKALKYEHINNTSIKILLQKIQNNNVLIFCLHEKYRELEKYLIDVRHANIDAFTRYTQKKPHASGLHNKSTLQEYQKVKTNIYKQEKTLQAIDEKIIKLKANNQAFFISINIINNNKGGAI